MQTLAFDANGYITPSEKITVDLETLKHYFVDNFPNSETRKGLFDNYLRYLDAFAKEITPNFTQWINGSFVTQKENPKDIDFVTFIDAAIFEQKTSNGILHNYYSFSWEKENVDAYILDVFPENDFNFLSHTVELSNQWFRRFKKVKENPNLSKGFLEISFYYE
jgi:hypothetical protein